MKRESKGVNKTDCERFLLIYAGKCKIMLIILWQAGLISLQFVLVFSGVR